LRTGPPRDDVTRMLDFRDTAQLFGILSDKFDNLLEQLGIRNQITFAEIHEVPLQPVSLCQPAVFVNERPRIDAPSLVPHTKAIEHANQAHIYRRDSDCIMEPGTHIANAHLQRREARARPNIPPEFGGVLDEARRHHLPQETLIFTIAVEQIRYSSARGSVEHTEPLGYQACFHAFPKWGRRTQHQQMRHEITGLTHQIDSEVFVFNSNVDMKAANQQTAGQRLKIPGEEFVSFLVGVLLIVPQSEWVCRSGNGRQPVLSRHLGNGRPQMGKICAGL